METTRIKIVPGEPTVVGTITGLEEWEGNYGPAITLSLTTPDNEDVEVVEKAVNVDKQLARLGLDRETAIGETLAISKTPTEKDPAKGFFNLNRVVGGKPQSAPKPAANQATKPPASLGPRIAGLDDPEPTGKGHGGVGSQIGHEAKLVRVKEEYQDVTAFVLNIIVPEWQQRNVIFHAGDVNAAVATIMIGASKP